MAATTLSVIDSHTEGEPTRVIIDGWPELQSSTMAARRDEIAQKWDHLRAAAVLEPRGHAAIVAAILTPPVTAGAVAGVIFCNNVGSIGMCGHGTIGVVRTLEFLGRISPGRISIDTPVGTVFADLGDDHHVTIENVPSKCTQRDVKLDIPGLGKITGDVAYGGNWFFMAHVPELSLRLDNVPALLRASLDIREELRRASTTGDDGAEIDHIELFGPPLRADADARSFVLCPGGSYDRSPCGTGMSAKMMSLYERGELALDAAWHQESITGGLFVGSLHEREGRIVPRIRATAHITGEATLHLDSDDPYRFGIVGT
jgi:4-hydroxyproline epimerase